MGQIVITYTMLSGGPVVMLTNPVNGAFFTAPATVPLQATVTDTNGTVTNVAFYAGAAKLADVASAPYAFAWNNVTAGNYALKAVATDDGGASGISSVVNITVTNPPLTVTLQPQAQTFCGSGPASFTAGASGFPAPTVQWQVSTNNGTTWAAIPGATSTTYSFSAVSGDNGRQYRAAFTNTGGTATSSAATLTVNTLPTPVNAGATGRQNQVLIINIAALLGLCTAPDGDAFYLSSVSPLSTNGAPVAITATNTIIYQPAPGFTGTDSFSYTITDIPGCSATANVNVIVNP